MNKSVRCMVNGSIYGVDNAKWNQKWNEKIEKKCANT